LLHVMALRITTEDILLHENRVSSSPTLPLHGPTYKKACAADL
jgi:hypothetical protein